MLRSLLLLACLVLLGAKEAEPVLPKPSANAGKAGTYQVQCGPPGYSYYVCVPAKPAADAHYGLHLYFHGQNGQSGAGSFGQWKGRLIDAYGLIGINMCYADGDNAKDTAGKVAAAKAAVLQVMADYPVVPGRGMLACFSGGGMPASLWYSENARSRGLAWPFTAQALYSANFSAGVQPLPDTAWYIGVNTDEWTLANLGATQTARYGEALAALAKSGLDHRLLVVNHFGHHVPDQGIDAAAALFRRADLAHAPFLHQASYPKPLTAIVASANAGQLAAASAALAKLKEDPATAAQVADLRARIDARIATQIVLATELAANDPLLATFYGNLFANALKGHARDGELKSVLAAVAKERKAPAAAAALEAFAKGFSGVFTGGPVITLPGAGLLERLLKTAGEKSQYGMMASELLALPRAPGKTPGK